MVRDEPAEREVKIYHNPDNGKKNTMTIQILIKVNKVKHERESIYRINTEIKLTNLKKMCNPVFFIGVLKIKHSSSRLFTT